MKSAKDLGIRAPKGKIEKTIYKGSEEKATVSLMFSGDFEYNMPNNIQLDALGEVLSIKLIERLRELEGGAYSPRVQIKYIEKVPTARYLVQVFWLRA